MRDREKQRMRTYAVRTKEGKLKREKRERAYEKTERQKGTAEKKRDHEKERKIG